MGFHGGGGSRGDIRFENTVVFLNAILFPGIDIHDELIARRQWLTEPNRA